MPGYQTGRATLLRTNRQAYLFQREPVAAGTASAAFQLERINRSAYPWGASFHLSFTDASGKPADPGVFEIDIQTSDIDQDAQYCTINSWPSSSSLNASFVGRMELPTFYAKYVRGFVKTLTNNVYVSLLATR
jgi:hypothetical protein